MSFARNIQHITFATKSRRPVLFTKHRREMYQTMWDTLKKLDVYVHRIGGTDDHVHILCDLPPEQSVAEMLRYVKGGTSRWMKQSGFFPKFDGWAVGYFSRSCDPEDIPIISEYIQNQETHHKRLSWQEEMREFIIRAGGNPDVPTRWSRGTPLEDEASGDPTGD